MCEREIKYNKIGGQEGSQGKIQTKTNRKAMCHTPLSNPRNQKDKK